MKLTEATRDQYAPTQRSLHCHLIVYAVGIAMMFMSGGAFAQQVLRVDSVNGSVTGDGSAWNSSAFKSLHDALTEAANNSPNAFEIWVAQGTYETTGSSGPFELLNNVEILGGFTGSETARTERKPLENITILTGPASISVVTSTNTTTTARLDGFHIVTDNDALVLTDSSPIIANCTFSATLYGADIWGGAPQFINCVFSQSAIAVSAFLGASPTFINCLIHSNNNGVQFIGTALNMVNCTIADNAINGIQMYDGDATIVNSVLWGNETPATSEKTFRFPDSCLRSSES